MDKVSKAVVLRLVRSKATNNDVLMGAKTEKEDTGHLRLWHSRLSPGTEVQ